MNIYIFDPKEEKNINLTIPNWMITNRFVMKLIQKAIEHDEHQISVDSQQIMNLISVLKDSVKTFGHYELVHIETAEGEVIKISM